MHSIRLTSRVGADGTLNLSLPVGVTDADVEVIVVIQPRASAIATSAPEDLGWPPRFFEETHGCLHDDPLSREPEGDFETREPMP